MTQMKILNVVSNVTSFAMYHYHKYVDMDLKKKKAFCTFEPYDLHGLLVF